MKSNIRKIIAAIFVTLFTICIHPALAQQLDAATFSEKASNDTTAVLLDVRTEKEFTDGHIANAININFNSPGFAERVQAAIPKNKTVYAYCLSGGRSGKAAELLKEKGYKVYELNGGILKWRAAGLAEEKENNAEANTGFTKEQFAQLINSQQKVLVDFYAEWCAPCKIMEPYINRIERSKKNKVKVVRIDVDKNETLAQSLKIDALPVLHLYENGKLKWEHLGFISKKDLLKKIRL